VLGLNIHGASLGGLSGKLQDVTLICEIPDLARPDGSSAKRLKRSPDVVSSAARPTTVGPRSEEKFGPRKHQIRFMGVYNTKYGSVQYQIRE
jgi:hypothetical protein